MKRTPESSGPYREPYWLLREYAASAPNGAACDLGAGEGHNAYFPASDLGFTPVDAVDNNSRTLTGDGGHVLTPLRHAAQLDRLSLRTWDVDFREFNLGMERYTLVIAINSLHLCPKEFPDMVARIIASLQQGGRVMLSLITKTLNLPEGTAVEHLTSSQRANLEKAEKRWLTPFSRRRCDRPSGVAW